LITEEERFVTKNDSLVILISSLIFISNGMFKKTLSTAMAVLSNQQADWTVRLQAIEKLYSLVENDD
jgi:hypothetical protein